MKDLMHFDSRLAAWAAGFVLAAAAPGAFADDEGRHSRVPLNSAYRQECGACHVAYPPGLLPVASWQRLMTGLRHHFGADASLDANTTRTLSDWLAAHAATTRREAAQPPQDRITRSAWFLHEHDEVTASAWSHPAVKSPSNCAACHLQADQGDFSEHRIRIPR